MTDNDRILCQVLEQQLSLRLREGCRDVLLHLLPAPLRGLLYIALRFRNIGGLTGGMMAVLALVNDLMVVFGTFVLLRPDVGGDPQDGIPQATAPKGRSPAAGRGFVRQAGLMTASNMSGPHFTKPRICR